MLYIKKILKENKITIKRLATNCGMCSAKLEPKLKKQNDFTLKELEDIKYFLVCQKVIGAEFDIGDFLNEV